MNRLGSSLSRVGPLVCSCVGLCVGAGGCVSTGPEIKQFKPPEESVMPRHVMIARRGELDTDLDGFIDGVIVEAYFFNNDRQDAGADQPFHRDGTLSFKLFGPGQELLCEGEFNAATMARSQTSGQFGPAYGLVINFAARGYEDVRDRTAGRMDFEFMPSAQPERRAFGSAQVRLGPEF